MEEKLWFAKTYGRKNTFSLEKNKKQTIQISRKNKALLVYSTSQKLRKNKKQY